MNLRTRILLLIALLLGVMLALGGWGSRWLAAELSSELDTLALGVGQSVLEIIDDEELSLADNDSDVVVLVERTIEDEAGNILRASHRQVGQRITRVAVQLDNLPAQLLELPHFPAQPHLSALQIEAVTRSLDREAAQVGLRLTGGTLDRQFSVPKAGVADALDRYSRRLSGGLLALFVLGVGGALLIAQRVVGPLRQLRGAAREVGQGQRGVQVPSGSAVSEIRETISSFNQMSLDLEELAAARSRLADRDHLSELGEIGRGLAHSLRNPLNSIGLTIDRLAAGRVQAEDGAKMAAEARRQIGRIDDQIRGFLTLASANQAVSEAVDLRAVIRDVTLELLQSAGEVAIDIDAPRALSIDGVGSEIRAMIHALAVNAVEASRSGQTVHISLQVWGDGVSVSIRDQGRGISPEIADRLFLPHTTSKADGSGMGLYLTRRLAESHYRGKVSLQGATEAAASGPGTMATLYLHPRLAIIS
ncbi:MAG: PAS domain-containing sensor histidine kinase [Lysobacterales bacterium]